jgi:hypothetical protein
LELKLLLKRGALLAAANWQTVAIQFAARLTFQALLAIPVVAAAVLVATLLGIDVGNLLRGGVRETVTAVANALLSEPAALSAFIAAFAIALLGGSVFMFLVKGGTVSVLVTAEERTGPVEQDPLNLGALRHAGAFSVESYTRGCASLFRRYLALGLLLVLVYALSAAGYLAFVVYAYQSAARPALVVGWTFVAAVAAVMLVVWITIVNVAYLLMQIAIAVDDGSLRSTARRVVRFLRAAPRSVGRVFLVVLAMIVGATLVSALAWSAIALVSFVPLVGLVVIPLQLVALVLRGLLFEYIGLTGLGAYLALYRRYRMRAAGAAVRAPLGSRPGAVNVPG